VCELDVDFTEGAVATVVCSQISAPIRRRTPTGKHTCAKSHTRAFLIMRNHVKCYVKQGRMVVDFRPSRRPASLSLPCLVWLDQLRRTASACQVELSVRLKTPTRVSDLTADFTQTCSASRSAIENGVRDGVSAAVRIRLCCVMTLPRWTHSMPPSSPESQACCLSAMSSSLAPRC
jgi:hypothetical protein